MDGDFATKLIKVEAITNPMDWCHKTSCKHIDNDKESTRSLQMEEQAKLFDDDDYY